MTWPAVAAATAAVAALLTGCGSDVVAGSRVVVAVDAPFTSLNPATSFGRSSTTNGDVASLTGSVFAAQDDAYRLVEDRSFGTAVVVDDDPFTVRYTVSADARWSDGEPVDAADLLLAWAANSGALNTPDFDDAPYVDAGTGRYEEPFPDGVVFFDGAIGAGLEHATALPELGDDDRSITVVFDARVPAWRTVLSPQLPAHVVAERALDLGADADAADAKAALVEAVVGRDADALAAVARVWNDDWNLADADPDGAPPDDELLVGSGPYLVDELDPGRSVTLVANPGYRGAHRPSYETIVLRYSPDPLETVRLVADGEVDIASPAPSAEVVDGLLDLDGVVVTPGTEANAEHLDLQFAGSRSGLFADPRVRQAFLHVVPRQQIVEELLGPVQQAAPMLDSFTLRPGADGYEDAVASNGSDAYAAVDVDAAIALLAQAGIQSPEVCVLYDPASPRRQTEFQLIQASAALAGFRVTDCSNPEWDELLGVPGSYDAALFAWDTTRLGPAAIASVFHSGSPLANFSGYASDDVDELVDELISVDDADEQAGILAEIDEHLWADAYGVPLFAYPTVTAVREGIEGVTRAPTDRTVFWNAWAWEPAAG